MPDALTVVCVFIGMARKTDARVGAGGLTTAILSALEVMPRQEAVTDKVPLDEKSDAEAVKFIVVAARYDEETVCPLT